MKGICFIEQLFHATVEGRKTMTRRIMKSQPIFNDNHSWIGGGSKSRYNVGEVVYLKEPYVVIANDGLADYHYYEFNGDHPFGTDGFFPEEWSNKLFMPASAARYFIRITTVRYERLKKISEEDCKLEGCRHVGTDKWLNDADGKIYKTGVEAYAALIDKINGRGTWDSNPFVWVYEYELCEKPE